MSKHLTAKAKGKSPHIPPLKEVGFTGYLSKKVIVQSADSNSEAKRAQLLDNLPEIFFSDFIHQLLFAADSYRVTNGTWQRAS